MEDNSTSVQSLFKTRTSRLRTYLLRRAVIGVVLVSTAILVVVLLGMRRTAHEMCQTLIEASSREMRRELQGFFGRVEAPLRMARGWGVHGGLEVGDPLPLNRLFMPLLEHHPHVSSLMVAQPGGREYMLLRQGPEFVTRLVDIDAGGPEAQRQHWSAPDKELRTWRESKGYDPRARPWYMAAVAETQDAVAWTEPYTFFTSREPGITASLAWRPLGSPNAAPSVLAMDVLLSDVSRFTTSLRPTENGLAFVMTEDGRVLGLPADARFVDEASLRSSILLAATELEIPALDRFLADWRPLATAVNDSRSVRVGGERWWGTLRPFQLDGTGRLWFGVLVPESDLSRRLNTQRNVLVGILLVALLSAIAVGSQAAKRMRTELARTAEEARDLGQYHLIAELGSGAMGTVYKARHSMLRRETAVKVLQPDLAFDKEATARFEREVRLTSTLTHPNTIAIFDYGKTPDGRFYYAMEYLEGITLGQLVREDGPLSPGRVIHLLSQAAGSLAEAHEVGLVHRDIKPDNLMLCQRGGRSDIIKVLDFGLVKRQDAQSVQLTQPDVLSGTPAYMAPEMIEHPDAVGPASDLYALGAVGYFLLTGQSLFAGESLVAVLGSHLHDAPPRPSARLGRPLPQDLEDLVLSCLAKTPADRPASARALRAALLACSSEGEWTDDDADRWWCERYQDCRGQDEAVVLESGEADLAVDLQSRR